MRIAQLTPGAGQGFYCENCLRDNAQARALHALGHKVLLVPLYLPPADDRPDEPVPESQVFFGGINVYLQQKLGLFRHTPRWLDRLFDAPALLRWASRKAGMTDAHLLGETTLSMLEGAQGHQSKELQRLMAFLASDDVRPDVVILSNALLAGMAPALADSLDAAVVCLLQDEDGFLDKLPEPYRGQCWQLVRTQCESVDHFISSSRYFADEMADRLSLAPDRVSVVPAGLDAEGYPRPTSSPPTVPTIGYLSEMCRGKGVDLLVDAFLRLRADGREGNLRLRLAGGSLETDEPVLTEIRQRIAEAGATADVDFVTDYDRDHKIAFLHSLSVLSVPTRHGEAAHLYLLEALAAGVPVVAPNHGAPAETIRETAGGLIVEPDNPTALADALAQLLDDTNRADRLGRAGQAVVLDRHDITRTATRLADCLAVVHARRQGHDPTDPPPED